MNTLKPYQSKYISNVLYKLNIPVSDSNILKHVDTIYEFIDTKGGYATTTKRDYLIVLSLLLKNLKQHDTSKFVYSRALHYSKKHNDREMSQTLDDNEKQNYITYNELTVKLEELIKIFRDKPTLNNIIRVLVLSLYVLQPPIRNNYGDMKVIHNRDDNDMKDNYLLIDNDTDMYIILNNDKVIKHYGSSNIKITNERLRDIITIYVTEYTPNNIYLFENKDGSPYTKRQIQYVINRMFHDRTLSIYNLRSSYISEYYRQHPKLKDRKELAVMMRHSQPVAELNYLKFI
jgi:hypothetical protein